jgi:ABC-2 type transport system permease protein
MRKALAVLKREYLEVVRKKTFIIMTLILPFLMAALMFVPTLLMMKGIESKRVVVVDGTARLQDVFGAKRLASATEPPVSRAARELGKRAQAQQGGKALELKTDYVAATGEVKAAAQPFLEQLRENDGSRPERLDGVLLIPSDAFTNTDAKLVYYSRAVSDIMTEERLANTVNQALSRERLAGRGIAAAEADHLLKRLELEGIKVSKSGEEKKGGELSFIVGFIFAALLLFPTMIHGQEVMRGIVQEKTERVVEILISSMPSFDLLSGKVMGLALVGLTQVGAWLAMGAAMAVYTGGAALVAGVNVFQFVDLRIIPWFFVFFLLGYLTFVCIYAVGGAISNSEKEAQQFMGPIMMVAMVPWMLAFPILQNPESRLATVLSLIPVFTPITMFMRMIVSEPPLWQVAISVVLSIATVVAFFWMTAKIFRVGILSYGKRPSPAELWRWLKVA